MLDRHGHFSAASGRHLVVTGTSTPEKPIVRVKAEPFTPPCEECGFPLIRGRYPDRECPRCRAPVPWEDAA